jgi:acyl-CoA synthetase (AMP-forming)/AMP-acid ligase II
VGELRARGANIMQGYWNDPEGTAQVLRDGWLHTGDLARVDDDGFIHVVGRKSALIKRAGYRLHPVELETFVRSRCGVEQVVAVSFPRAGDPGLAVYVEGDRESVSAREILAVCQRELPRYKVPDHVEVLDRFPVTSATKVDRPALSQRAAAAVSKVPAPHFRLGRSPAAQRAKVEDRANRR